MAADNAKGRGVHADSPPGVIDLRLFFYVRLIGLNIGQCARPNLVIDLALATIKTRKFVFVYLFFVFRNNTGNWRNSGKYKRGMKSNCP